MSSQKNLLKAAIKGKREDIIEHLLTMKPGVKVDTSILRSVIVETENKYVTYAYHTATTKIFLSTILKGIRKTTNKVR